MESRKARDEIERTDGDIFFHDVAHDEENIRALRQGASRSDDVRVSVDGDYLWNCGCNGLCKEPGATADIKRATCCWRDVLKKERVVVDVVVPHRPARLLGDLHRL